MMQDLVKKMPGWLVDGTAVAGIYLTTQDIIVTVIGYAAGAVITSHLLSKKERTQE